MHLRISGRRLPRGCPCNLRCEQFNPGPACAPRIITWQVAEDLRPGRTHLSVVGGVSNIRGARATPGVHIPRRLIVEDNRRAASRFFSTAFSLSFPPGEDLANCTMRPCSEAPRHGDAMGTGMDIARAAASILPVLDFCWRACAVSGLRCEFPRSVRVD